MHARTHSGVWKRDRESLYVAAMHTPVKINAWRDGRAGDRAASVEGDSVVGRGQGQMVEGEPKSAPKAARATSYLQEQKKKNRLSCWRRKVLERAY
jgi:hypothetical protein